MNNTHHKLIKKTQRKHKSNSSLQLLKKTRKQLIKGGVHANQIGSAQSDQLSAVQINKLQLLKKNYFLFGSHINDRSIFNSLIENIASPKIKALIRKKQIINYNSIIKPVTIHTVLSLTDTHDGNKVVEEIYKLMCDGDGIDIDIDMVSTNKLRIKNENKKYFNFYESQFHKFAAFDDTYAEKTNNNIYDECARKMNDEYPDLKPDVLCKILIEELGSNTTSKLLLDSLNIYVPNNETKFILNETKFILEIQRLIKEQNGSSNTVVNSELNFLSIMFSIIIRDMIDVFMKIANHLQIESEYYKLNQIIIHCIYDLPYVPLETKTNV